MSSVRGEKTTIPNVGWWLVLSVFLGCVAIYSWSNNFPYFYHPDEESKTLQILQHYRNLWHPLLLVNSADLVTRLTNLSADEQTVTRCGRFVCAFFGAGSVAVMTLLALRRHGLAVAATFAFFWGTLPLLFEVSHYFKEDTALLLGISLVLLALDAFSRRNGVREVVFLALACAVAVSAKYVGLILWPIALLVLIIQTKSWKLATLFIASSLGGLLALDWQWLFSPVQLWQGITRESGLLATGHFNMIGVSSYWKYRDIFTNNLSSWMLALCLCGLLFCSFRKPARQFEWALAGTSLLFLLSLCLLNKSSDRYLLPFLCVCFYFFSIGLVRLASWFFSWIEPRLLPLAILGAWWPQAIELNKTRLEFATDSRGDLADWIKSHLPPGTRVGTSLWTRLPGHYEGQLKGGPPLADFVADLGSFADLRAEHIDYVAVAQAECERFATGGIYSEHGSDQDFLRRQNFYRELMENRPPLWQQPLGRIYILHPGLRLYAVPE